MFGVLIALAIRALLVGLFLPFSALDKVLNYRLAIAQARERVPSQPSAAALIAGGFCVEVSMSLAVLTGVADRLAALILAGYCLVTALMWKPFWRAPDFRLKGPSRGRDVFWDFLKNLALAGGLLLLTFGSDATGAARFLAHPFASSHPYRLGPGDPP